MSEDHPIQASDSKDFDNGEWYASTLGHFISVLIDSGPDPAIIFRVVEDGPVDGAGMFVRKYEIVSVPNTHVREQIEALGVENGHVDLTALLDAGVIS